jgi:hypothetical protein
MYRERFKIEMNQFPFGKHEDGIDALSYIYDMLADFGFKYRVKRKKTHLRMVRPSPVMQGLGWLRA